MPGRQVAPEASLESAADHVLFPEESLQKSQAPLMVGREQERVKRVDQGDMSARERLCGYNGKCTMAQRYYSPFGNPLFSALALILRSFSDFDAHGRHLMVPELCS